MPVRTMIVAIVATVATVVIYSPVRADGTSPSPTTSPSSSRTGTLIQTDVFPNSNRIAILKADRNKYAKSRAAMSRAAREFQAVAGQLKGKVSAKQQARLISSLKSFNRATKSLGTTVNKSLVRGNPGNKLASVAMGFIRFDGVDGRIVDDIRKIATELRSINRKLGKLEPVAIR